MPRATGCSPHCWLSKAIPAAPAAIEGSAGWARAMGDVSRGSAEMTEGLGDRYMPREKHLQALSVRHRDARRHRRLPGPAARACSAAG